MSSGQPGAEMDILVPISALEHFSYCPRQCALIHVEQTFDENVFTVRGRLSHERADLGETTAPRGVRQLRALPLWSDEYGLIGKADVVELHPEGPVPVEYKVGRSHWWPRGAPALRAGALPGGDVRRAGPGRRALLVRDEGDGFVSPSTRSYGNARLHPSLPCGRCSPSSSCRPQ